MLLFFIKPGCAGELLLHGYHRPRACNMWTTSTEKCGSQGRWCSYCGSQDRCSSPRLPVLDLDAASRGVILLRSTRALPSKTAPRSESIGKPSHGQMRAREPSMLGLAPKKRRDSRIARLTMPCCAVGLKLHACSTACHSGVSSSKCIRCHPPR